MKKGTLLALALVILSGIGIAIYFLQSENRLSDTESRDFAVKSTNAINKIFLASKSGEKVTLTKENDHWLVDGKFPARKARIKNLLETIQKVKVRNRVPSKTLQTVLNNLSSTHTKIEIFENNKITKSYFVGGPDKGSLGTYMLLIDPETGKNAELPFVTYILGFEGYLTPRYDPNPDNWRDLSLFSFPRNEIKSIDLKYPSEVQKSFKIELVDGQYKLHQNSNTLPFSDQTLKQYILGFKQVSAETLITKKNNTLFEKLKKTTPFFSLKVTSLDNRTYEILGYKRKAKSGETNMAGQPIEFDEDRFYGIVFDGEELCILQYYVFDKLLRTPDFFQ